MTRGKHAQTAANTAVKREADEKVAALKADNSALRAKLQRAEQLLAKQRVINDNLRQQIQTGSSAQVKELERQLLEMTIKQGALLARQNRPSR